MKRPPKDPVTGITPGAMRTLLKSALRPIWRRTSRKTFLESVRYKATNPKTGRLWNVVDCQNCGRVMGVSEKERRPLVNGGLSKKPRSVFECHHKHGIAPLGDVRATLGEYFHDLIYGEMEILCFKCHGAESDIQRKQKKTHNK